MKRNTIHTVTVSQLKTRATASPLTDADAVVKVKELDRSGATVLAETAMTYSGTPGTSTYDTPASSYIAGADPWTVEVVTYDLTGLNPRDTMRFTEKDEIARG